MNVLWTPWGQKQRRALLELDWTGNGVTRLLRGAEGQWCNETAKIQQREEQVANCKHFHDAEGELYGPDTAN